MFTCLTQMHSSFSVANSYKIFLYRSPQQFAPVNIASICAAFTQAPGPNPPTSPYPKNNLYLVPWLHAHIIRPVSLRNDNQLVPKQIWKRKLVLSAPVLQGWLLLIFLLKAGMRSLSLKQTPTWLAAFRYRWPSIFLQIGRSKCFLARDPGPRPYKMQTQLKHLL